MRAEEGKRGRSERVEVDENEEAPQLRRVGKKGGKNEQGG